MSIQRVVATYQLGGHTEFEVEVTRDALKIRALGSRRWQHVTPWATVVADIEAGELSDGYRALFAKRSSRRKR